MSYRSYTFKSANAHEHTHSKCQRKCIYSKENKRRADYKILYLNIPYVVILLISNTEKLIR